MTAELRKWFHDKIEELQYEEPTKAYITSVLHKYVVSHDDLSKSSIVMLYADANGNFKTYQSIGDWVLWSGTFCPKSLEDHLSTHVALARMSYYRCYKILDKKWRLYEELADQLPRIIIETRNTVHHSITNEKCSSLLI